MEQEKEIMHLKRQVNELILREKKMQEEIKENNKLLNEIKTGLLGSPYNGDDGGLIDKVDNLKVQMDSFMIFKKNFDGYVAKGLGVIAGIAIVVQFAWGWIIDHIKK